MNLIDLIDIDPEWVGHYLCVSSQRAAARLLGLPEQVVAVEDEAMYARPDGTLVVAARVTLASGATASVIVDTVPAGAWRLRQEAVQ